MAVTRPPGKSIVAETGDVKLMVTTPTLPADAGSPLYAQEMHWPPT
jgi:hypothetical protein